MHLIHVNAKGLQTLKNGGPLPYPDEPSSRMTFTNLGERRFLRRRQQKAIAVMVKDTRGILRPADGDSRCGAVVTVEGARP